MNKELLDKLYMPFKLKQRKGLGGMIFDFIPTEDVINRMNVVFDGNWSTEIITQEIIEEFVLVRVRVSVINGTGVAVTHEGYGSGQIQRYTSGANKGKLLDIGNAYKSAESKAIKNACTRFGVGLYFKEEDIPETIGGDTAENTTVVEKTNIEKVLDMIEVPPVMTPKTMSSPEVLPQTFAPPIEATKPVVQNPGFNIPPFEVPPVSIEPSVEKPVEQVSLPPNLPRPSTGSVVKETLREAPFNTNTPKNSGVSDVQLAALNGILSIKKIPLKELLTKSFESANMSTDTIPDGIDGLNYSQAVAVIKYGNGVYRTQ